MQKLMSILQLLTEILGGAESAPSPVVGRPKKVGVNRVKAFKEEKWPSIDKTLYSVLDISEGTE